MHSLIYMARIIKMLKITLRLQTLNLSLKLSECSRRYGPIPRGYQETTIIKVVMSSFIRRKNK